MLIPFLMLIAAPEFTEADRAEATASYIQCAAFHRIEADRASGDAVSADAHRSSASDFLEVALHLAGSAKVEKVNADLAALEASYRDTMKSGDVRALAESWTQLEAACTELHQLRTIMLGKTGGEEKAR